MNFEKILPFLFLFWSLSACSLLKELPEPQKSDERLQVFDNWKGNVQSPVTVYWNEHNIPYIVAENDDDAAYTLGAVHAHLRLGQMETIRRIALSRAKELVFEFGDQVDTYTKLLDLGRKSADIYAHLPPDSKQWLDRYVQGINDYKNSHPLPFDFAFFDIENEQWSPIDSITMARLSGIDINWLSQFQLLEIYNKPSWQEIWQELHQNEEDVSEATQRLKAAAAILFQPTKSGSNAWAIAPKRSKNGSALMAADPHLGFSLPNFWVLGGLKSPSYHTVGASFPGFPIFAFGRNTHLAWSGTHMRAATSDLVAISSQTILKDRGYKLGGSFFGEKIFDAQDSEYGPIISPLFETTTQISIKWMGHHVSDELTAGLKMMRSQNPIQFRKALESWSLPPQNFLYADNQGNIGQVFATHLPKRSNGKPTNLLISEQEARNNWKTFFNSSDLPYIENPADGYIISANNKPTVSTDWPIGWHFADPQRFNRATSLIKKHGKVNISDLSAMQLDVYSKEDHLFRDEIVMRLEKNNIDTWLLERLKNWDGNYSLNSKGAPAYEAMLYGFREVISFDVGEIPIDITDIYVSYGLVKEKWLQHIDSQSKAKKAKTLRLIVSFAKSWLDPSYTWGDIHRIVLQHPAGMIPLIGNQFKFANIPTGGSRNTILKSNHKFENDVHESFYGSQSRFVSELNDVDSNYFLLLGGQDGWLQNESYLSMVPLWQKGEYIQIPLLTETVVQLFHRKTQIKPL